MGAFLRFIGLASVAITVGWMVITAATGSMSYVVSLLPWLLPGIVSGVVLAAFGSIVTEVQDMRRAADKQTELLMAIRDRLGR